VSRDNLEEKELFGKYRPQTGFGERKYGAVPLPCAVFAFPVELRKFFFPRQHLGRFRKFREAREAGDIHRQPTRNPIIFTNHHL
jgi:hypothetical protein